MPGKAADVGSSASCLQSAGDGKSPPVAGLDDWYLYDQLRKFRDRKRGYHEDDKEGIAMGVAVQGMSDEQFRDIAVFILAELNPDPMSDE